MTLSVQPLFRAPTSRACPIAVVAIWAAMLLLPFTTWALEAPVQSERTFAVFHTRDAQTTSVGEVLTLTLARIEGVKLVAPARLSGLAEELDISALSEAGHLADRRRLGQEAGATELMILSQCSAPADRQLRLTICDGFTGLQLRTEILELDNKRIYEVAERIKESIQDTHHFYPGGVTQVVCLSAFLGKAIPATYNSLPARYTELLRESLRDTPGVAVVESDEAMALSRPVTPTEHSGRKPIIPVVRVEGEIHILANSDDPSAAPQITFEVRITPAAAPEEHLRTGPLSPESAASYLALELPRAILRNTGRADTPITAAQRFTRLAEHAEALAQLGHSEDSASLRESAILIQPDSIEQRLKLIDDYGQIVATSVPNVSAYELVELGHTPNLRIIERGARAYAARFAHVEYLIQGRRVPVEQAQLLSDCSISGKVISGPYARIVDGKYCVLGEKSLLLAEEAKERFILQAMPALIAWHTQCPQRGLAQNWERTVISGMLRRQDRTYRSKAELDFITRVLSKVIPESFSLSASPEREVQAFLEQQVTWTNSTPLGEPLATEADWLEFLSNLEKSGNRNAKQYAAYGRKTYKSGGQINRYPSRTYTAVLRNEGPAPNRRELPPLGGAWTMPRDQTGSGTIFETLNIKIHGLDGTTLPARNVRYISQHGWFGLTYIEPCGPSLDVWRYPGAILFMRERGILEEVLVDDTAVFEDSRWDGEAVWITSRNAGVWVVKPDGTTIARFTDESGLPPADNGIVIQPIAPGRAIAVGSYGLTGRAWCALLECNGDGGNSVKVFHEANRLGCREEIVDTIERDPTLCFHPAWLHAYEAKGGSRRILVGRDVRGGAGASRPLEINPDTLAVRTFDRCIQRAMSSTPRNSYFSRDGFLLEGCGGNMTLYAPPGERLENGQESKVLSGPRGNGGDGPIFSLNGWVYTTGPCWSRIDPKTWSAQRLDAEDLKPWRIDRCTHHLGVSSHYGLIAWDGDVFCQIVDNEPPPTTDAKAAAVIASGTFASKGVKLLTDPSAFSDKAVLIDFETENTIGGEVRQLDNIYFALVNHDMTSTIGAAPTIGSTSDQSCAREFAPKDGPNFLRNASSYASNTDLHIKFFQWINRVAFEIRSGNDEDDVRELRFELYNLEGMIGSATVRIRGKGRFYFYGIESTETFDTMIIRQLPNDQFDLDNLRYEPQKEE